MTAATTNGTKAPVAVQEPLDVLFPLDSYREAASHLRRPFTARAVKFKVQATWPKANPHSGLIVAYIDARLAVERLNLVCPHLWHDDSKPVEGSNGLLKCSLTIDGITRSDVGEGYVGKGLWSDALKRAAVRFGVGVSLYAIPKIVLKVADGHLESKQGKLALTTAGERRCRELYAAWLEAQGIEAFGQPLDHGDVEDAVGDYDTGGQPERDDRPAVVRDQPQPDPEQQTQPAPAQQRLTNDDHEQAIAELIASDDELRELRTYVNEGMRAAGAGPRQRHQFLRDHQSKAQLEDLKTRVDNAQDQAADAATDA